MSILATRADYFAVGRRAVLTTPGLKINPRMVDVVGSDINLLIGAPAVMCEEATSRGASCMRGLFVDTATKDALARVAYDRYQLTSFPATPSNMELIFTRPTPGVATPGTLVAGFTVQTADGLQFATDVDVTFGDFDTSQTVSATCLTAGADTNAAAGAIVQLSAAPFDPNLSVSNAAGAAGGTDAETDIQFRGRIRGYLPTIRRGTLGAIQYAALTVAGVAVATAIETLNPDGMPAAFVQLTVADKDGNASPAMLTAVSNALLQFRACGIPVQVLAGVPTYQAVRWKVDYRPGIDEQEAQNRLRLVTVAVAQFLPPGPQQGILYRSQLLAAAKMVPGIIVFDDARGSSLQIPAGDVVPATQQQTIRVRAQDVTFSI